MKTKPNERGIIFTGESVSGILVGTKTMTRRIVKTPKKEKDFWLSEAGAWKKAKTGELHETAYDVEMGDNGNAYFLVAGDQGYTDDVTCPYGKVGDRLYVRETWRTEELDTEMTDGVRFPDGTFQPIENSAAAAELWGAAHDNGKYGTGWRSPLFMPRWASRLTLEITGIRVERLQEITEEDAIAEGVRYHSASGVYGDDICFKTAKLAFAHMWDKINGKRVPWSENPWAWVIEFKSVGGE